MTKERARLTFADTNDSPVLPSVDPATIKTVAKNLGFRETPKLLPIAQVPEPLIRRARRKTGRVHQFATRLHESTVREIYDYADRHDITLAEVIERAMEALNQERQSD
jgi:hypothetical protein